MKKTQITSPIIIFMLLILALSILYYKTKTDNKIIKSIQDEGLIDSKHHEEIKNELRFRNQITSFVLKKAGKYNNTNQLTQIINQEYPVNNINYLDKKIIINYTYNSSGTIIVPYPVRNMIEIEEEFDKNAFKDCLVTCDCLNFEICTNNLDTGEYDLVPELCLTNPLRIRINIMHKYSYITSIYPYHMWNNSLLRLECE